MAIIANKKVANATTPTGSVQAKALLVNGKEPKTKVREAVMMSEDGEILRRLHGQIFQGENADTKAIDAGYAAWPDALIDEEREMLEFEAREQRAAARRREAFKANQARRVLIRSMAEEQGITLVEAEALLKQVEARNKGNTGDDDNVLA